MKPRIAIRCNVWMLAFLALSPLSRAQEANMFAQADAAIDATYKNALRFYPSASVATLQKAQGAWVEFAYKNAIFLYSLQQEDLLTKQKAQECQVFEVHGRVSHLQDFFTDKNLFLDNPDKALKFLEESLSSTYQKLFAQLNPKDQELLRDAEQSWAVYRDLDTDAEALASHQSGDPAAWKTATRAMAASTRAATLNALIVRMSSANAATAPTKPSVPFDDAAEISNWQKQVKDVANELSAKKDDPFWQPASDLKNLAAIPEGIAPKVTAAWNALVDLRKAESAHGLHAVSAPLDHSSNEAALIAILQSWIVYGHALKDGFFEATYKAESDQFSRPPEKIDPEFAPIWNKLLEWKKVIESTYADFEGHVVKAKAAADYGKSSEALREYQAAYAIFPDTEVSKTIKKMKEQSLGL